MFINKLPVSSPAWKQEPAFDQAQHANEGTAQWSQVPSISQHLHTFTSNGAVSI